MTAPEYPETGDLDQGQSWVTASHRFAQIPEWILYHPELEGLDVRVFGCLLRHDGIQAIPSLARVGRLCGNVSDQTARRAVRRLEAVGAVTVTERYDGEGRQRSNRYVLHITGPSCPVPPITGDRDVPITDATPGAITDDRAEREQQEREQDEREKNTPSAVADAFEAWWRTYPHKVGKPAAFRSWRSLVGKGHVPVEVIVEGTQRWIAAWTRGRTEKRFIPHPTTFLNQRRFDDAPAAGRMAQQIDEDRCGESGRLAL